VQFRTIGRQRYAHGKDALHGSAFFPVVYTTMHATQSRVLRAGRAVRQVFNDLLQTRLSCHSLSKCAHPCEGLENAIGERSFTAHLSKRTRAVLVVTCQKRAACAHGGIRLLSPYRSRVPLSSRFQYIGLVGANQQKY
jgi:hypothetical protein